MITQFRRTIRLTSVTVAAIVGAAFFGPQAAAAQVIYTSFVPNNSYGATEVSIFSVASSANWLAASFGYVGGSVQLSSLRFAAQDVGDRSRS